MAEQPLDLTVAVGAPPPLVIQCSECRLLRREVHEMRGSLQHLADQFTSLAQQLTRWRRDAATESPRLSVSSTESLAASTPDTPTARPPKRKTSSPHVSPSRAAAQPPVKSPRAADALPVQSLSLQSPALSAAASNPWLSPYMWWRAPFLLTEANAVLSASPADLGLGSDAVAKSLLGYNLLDVGAALAQHEPVVGGGQAAQQVLLNASADDEINVCKLETADALDVEPSKVVRKSSGSRCEDRRGLPDDFMKEYIESSVFGSDSLIAAVEIPVPQAFEHDPEFQAATEEQIVSAVNWRQMDWRDAVTRLAKKLAEKRVFGAALMARATVAGTNHSNYPNLPIGGIHYIENVCRRVLFPELTRLEFADYFRPAVKCLAARCRRIRHSLKPSTPADDADD